MSEQKPTYGELMAYHCQKLKLLNDELLAACEAMLNAQSARRHPLGETDEGIAGLCADAASKARAAIAKAKGQ